MSWREPWASGRRGVKATPGVASPESPKPWTLATQEDRLDTMPGSAPQASELSRCPREPRLAALPRPLFLGAVRQFRRRRDTPTRRVFPYGKELWGPRAISPQAAAARLVARMVGFSRRCVGRGIAACLRHSCSHYIAYQSGRACAPRSRSGWRDAERGVKGRSSIHPNVDTRTHKRWRSPPRLPHRRSE